MQHRVWAALETRQKLSAIWKQSPSMVQNHVYILINIDIKKCWKVDLCFKYWPEKKTLLFSRSAERLKPKDPKTCNRFFRKPNIFFKSAWKLFENFKAPSHKHCYTLGVVLGCSYITLERLSAFESSVCVCVRVWVVRICLGIASNSCIYAD